MFVWPRISKIIFVFLICVSIIFSSSIFAFAEEKIVDNTTIPVTQINEENNNVEENLEENLNKENESLTDNNKNENTSLSEEELTENEHSNSEDVFAGYASNRGFVSNVSVLRCGLKDNGCVQSFVDSNSNRFAVYGDSVRVFGDVKLSGAIGNYWASNNWENSKFGYPLGTEKSLGGFRWVQEFEHGFIYYQRGKGIVTVDKNHPVGAQYFMPNKDNVFPINNLKCGLKNNGCVQSFVENGNRIGVYFSNNGVVPVMLDDEIIKFWAKTGWENSRFGYPLSSRQDLDGGYYYVFENNIIVHESGNIHVLDRNIDVNQYLAVTKDNEDKISQYYENNKQRLGVIDKPGKCGLKYNGCVQSFKNNTGNRFAVYSWTNPATNTNSVMEVKLNGAIGKHWVASTWENSRFGYPISVEKRLNDIRWVQEFEHGFIYYQRGIGVISVDKTHPITTQYFLPNKDNVFPVNNLRCGLKNNGCVQSFVDNTGKKAVYSYNGNVVVISLDNPNIKKWASTGYENSFLGYPIQNVGVNGSGVFENGSISGDTITINDKAKAYQWYYDRYYKNYSVKSALRCGLKDEGCVATVTHKNTLEDIAIYVTPRNGIVPVELESKVGKLWARSNWENSKYGYPVGKETCNGSYCSQKFEKGTIKQDHTTYMDLPFVNQMANGAPMGCEGASLLQVLYYFGKYSGNLKQLLDSQPYSPDPWNPTLGYAGSPYKNHRQDGYAGFHPHKFTPWANNFGVKAVNISNQGVEQIKKEIRRGNPVVYWGTFGFVPPYKYTYYSWGITIDNEHVVTIDGYQNGMFHITDPAYAKGPKYWISEEHFKQNYDIYKYAVAVRNK